MISSPPERIFPRGLTHRIAALLLSTAVVSGLLLSPLALDPAWLWPAVLVTLLGLGLYWVHEAGRKVEIHPEGLVLRRGTSCRVMPWDSVREVRYRAVGSKGAGVFAHLAGGLWLLLGRILKPNSRTSGVDERAVSIRCILQGDGERPLVLTSGWSRAADAVAEILSHVNPRLLQEALNQVRRAGRAEFGPVVVLHDSIVRGNRSVRFAEVGSCGVERGRFFVRKQGAWLTAIQVPVGKIPNAFVLVELLRHLGVPGLRQADLASATLHG